MTSASKPQDERGESRASIWRRRTITVPAYLTLAALFLVAVPLWGPVTLVWDLRMGQGRRIPRARSMAFITLYLLCEALGIIIATLIWLGTLGGRLGGPDTFIHANALLQRYWTAVLFWGLRFFFSIRVIAEDLELASSGPLLVFVRHTGTSDTLLAAALVANPHKLLLRYVIKRELLWDPCVDIVGRRLPNAFIDRTASRKDAEIAAIAQLARNLDERSAALIYPEGTRFSEEKLSRGVQALREKGMDRLAAIAAEYRTVLPPRVRGPLALLEAAPDVDIVFLEHTGLEGAATIPSLWNGALVGRTLRVRLRRFTAAEIPTADRDLWLFQRWAEIDRWTQEHVTPRSAAD